ncbi:hypothetical protein AArcSl_2464 [Halalkaliarchaeum desulfuricum]|uniref:ArsR family transcriptional regulator n=1 Tax=Halalkaliarchaeum desulfuricum TaxID=2055893 RepID=A0A343TLW3_9EURY|nr:helix-turn-helix domain-containing protein [Halalkaliarchaeum desulfuricum]AUX10085.1 hypothetical protein AArcSl_2464 [Halalkaliarchaeum desulfuricum]
MVSTESEASKELTPEEAFAILGDETRIAILQTLWRTCDTPIRFGALRQEVGHDDPGNFNYHLSKLTGQFVRKTEQGYELREAGKQVIRAVLAGTINRKPRIDSDVCDSKCPYCGAPVELQYVDERVLVRCTECPGIGGEEYPEGTYMRFAFPPAGIQDRTPEEIIEAAHAFYDAKVTPMMSGVCPECAGRVETTIDICHDHDSGDRGVCGACGFRNPIWADYSCGHCEYTRRCMIWFEILNHPGVVAFYYEHGLEETVPFSKLTWRNAPFISNVECELLETEPLRIRIKIPVDSEELRVTVNEAVEVVTLTRQSISERSQ